MHGSFQYEVAYEKKQEPRPPNLVAKLGDKLSTLKEKIKSPVNTPATSQVDLPLPIPRLDEAVRPFGLTDIDIQIKRGESYRRRVS